MGPSVRIQTMHIAVASAGMMDRTRMAFGAEKKNSLWRNWSAYRIACGNQCRLPNKGTMPFRFFFISYMFVFMAVGIRIRPWNNRQDGRPAWVPPSLQKTCPAAVCVSVLSTMWLKMMRRAVSLCTQMSWSAYTRKGKDFRPKISGQ